MQLRTHFPRNRSQDDYISSTVETPRTSVQDKQPTRIPLLSKIYNKPSINPFPFGSLPCSSENTFLDTDRPIHPTPLSSKRFKAIVNPQSRGLESPETTRPDSKTQQTHRKIGIVRPQTNQQYKKQKGLFKPPSLNLKEKISMNHFLFDSEATTSSPLYKAVPLELNRMNSPENGGIADGKQSENKGDASQPVYSRNIETPVLMTPKQESYGPGGFFKTSISTRDTKTPIQVLKEIKQSGPFRVTRPGTSNVTPVGEREMDEIGVTRFDGSNVNDMFKTKKSILLSHKQSLNTQQNQSKEILQRKIEIHETIEKNKGQIMVCALTEIKEFGNIRYCFIPRVLPKTVTPRSTRGMREDVEFKITLHEIQRKLHLDNSFKFVHLMDGLPIFAFYQVPTAEKVVIISQNSRLGDAMKIANHELVRKFIGSFEKRNESIYEVIAGFNTKERINQCRKEVLNIVDNTHQLNSDQLGNLVSISNQGSLLESTKAIQGAFLDGKVGSVLLEGERGSTYVDRSFLKPSKKSSYLETLAAPKNGIMRTTSLEIGVYETEVEKYIKSTRPLQEHKKLMAYKNIIKEYDETLKKVNRKSAEDDDEKDFDNYHGDQAVEDAQRLTAKALQIDKNLGKLLKTGDQILNRATSFSDSGQWTLPVTGQSMSKTNVKKEADLLNLSEKRRFDKEVESTIVEKKVIKKFTAENVKALETKKSCLKKLQRVNKELFLRNIPKMVNDKKLSRQELHSIYVLYKALCEVTSQRHREYDINDGIDFQTFRSGIYNVAMQSEEFAARLFYAIDTNFSGFLDWEEFLEVMVTLRARTLHDKIDLFIHLADEDGNGNLSKDEIFNLTKICLGKFIKKDDATDGFLDELCHYFTKLIFVSLGFDINDEIPLEAIKEAIVSGNPNSDLLAMFCGADL